HQAYTGTDDVPTVAFNALERSKIDDAVVLAVLARARAAGFDAYLLPQSPDLPMANRREDILITRPSAAVSVRPQPHLPLGPGVYVRSTGSGAGASPATRLRGCVLPGSSGPIWPGPGGLAGPASPSKTWPPGKRRGDTGSTRWSCTVSSIGCGPVCTVRRS